ncbi:helix-turn-helix domain-containing protein [Streptomyces sp. NPDC058486]|uniref:helix-turn-helix domain-containing protein n=1 Tax=unclassified Streptomyces TaxID=2593676 RepID=UPI003661BB5F
MNTGDRLAGRLRELKDRSGLSYGALAKRLHVSTSTLHRYCNGDAVPTDFAPVERLGRLCGASREELVELHRAWIVADETRGRSAEPVESVVEPVVEPVLVVTGDGDAPSPRRGRFKWVLAAVAVVALAVPGTYLVARNGDGEPGGGGKGGSGAVAAPAPLNAGISSYNWAEPCGQYYVLDQKPQHVPPPPPPQDTRGWARALGGIDGGHMQLQVTVTGRTQEPVVLSRLRVRVVGRDSPPERTAYSMGDGCGSGITPQTFDVDLDAPRPYVKAVAGQDGDRVVPAKDFPYQVATGDAEVLNLDVHTEEYAVAWYLELEWSTGARKGTVRIDDGGQPFRTHAIEGRTVYGYWPDKGEWVAQ